MYARSDWVRVRMADRSAGTLIVCSKYVLAHPWTVRCTCYQMLVAGRLVLGRGAYCRVSITGYRIFPVAWSRLRPVFMGWSTKGCSRFAVMNFDSAIYCLESRQIAPSRADLGLVSDNEFIIIKSEPDFPLSYSSPSFSTSTKVFAPHLYRCLPLICDLSVKRSWLVDDFD